MTFFRTVTGVLTLAILIAGALSVLPLGISAAEGKRSHLPQAKFTDKGVQGCLRCHAGEEMEVIEETAHGNAHDPHAPYAQHGCESCHGPGSLHASRARGGAGFPPLTDFGRGGDPVPQQLAACLDCHGTAMGDVAGMEWSGSLHDTGRITCSTCHRIHSTENAMADQTRQRENCARCHEKQIVNHHRLGGRFERRICYDCHDVHQLTDKEP
jgi:predicted CXXCH cytochrome family protein